MRLTGEVGARENDGARPPQRARRQCRMGNDMTTDAPAGQKMPASTDE